mmetsp:Transcript_28029/g.39400  ORF Transcript_28029/g.39400 Transcript_28029/m.39400 type:complete len:452 (+) Transcript_28029:76-1431(+)
MRRSVNRGRQPSGLQTKGLMMLWLVVLTETLAFSNAVTFYKTYQSWTEHHERGNRRGGGGLFEEDTPFNRAAQDAQKAQECANMENPVTTDCSSVPTSHPATSRMYPRSRLSKRVPIRKLSEDCSHHCSSCMDPAKVESLCAMIPRGGHVHSSIEEAVDKVSAAAATASGSKVAPYGFPLNGWKVIFQAFLTTLNVLCWLIPLRSKKISENKLALSLANAFSGGVFLSLAFAHLIPECVHGFHGFNEVMPYMIVLGGYLLIFFVEKVAFDAHGALHEMEHAGEEKEKPGIVNGDVGNSGSRSAVILLGALAVHSVLEMTALGLADSFGDSALLTLSIALHQPAESIALLVAFLKSGMPKGQIIKFLSIFSACGPIGVALGMAVNEFAAPIVDAIMLATVAGTFVYVGATEVIPEEWEDPVHKWKKFGALMAGIVSIFMITQYTMTLEGMTG